MPSNHLILCHHLLFLPSISPASESFPMSQFFTSGRQSIGASASASVLPMNIQDWFPLKWTGLISLQSKGLSRVFSNTTVQKHQFFGAQLSLWSNSHIYTWLLEKPHLWLHVPLVSHVYSYTIPEFLTSHPCYSLCEYWLSACPIFVSLNSAIHSHPWWITIHLRSIPNWFLNPLPLNSFIWWLHALLIIFCQIWVILLGFWKPGLDFGLLCISDTNMHIPGPVVQLTRQSGIWIPKYFNI